MAKKKESLFSPALRNVVARFRNMKQARRAIDALESHGFDAGAIRLEGGGASATATPETRTPDAGPVTVSAGSDDPVKVAHAHEALRDLDPIEVERVDEHGEPI